MKLQANHHQAIYLFGLVLMAVGLSTSNFLMSISQFILLGNWFWEGGLIDKFKRFLRCKPAVLLVSVYLLHLIGLFYTEDFNYALNDLRIKLPLLGLPVIVSSTAPLSARKFKWFLWFFIGAVVISSLISLTVYAGLTDRVVEKPRDISIFISHIRLSLLVCVAIIALGYFLAAQKQKPIERIAYATLTIWLVVFLFILEAITGIVTLLVCVFALISYFGIKQKRTAGRIAYVVLLVVLLFVAYRYIQNSVKEYFDIEQTDLENLERRTVNGEPYHSNLSNKEIENGHYVWIYIAMEELRTGWSKRSDLNIDGMDKNEQPLHATLIRFLASKGLRKDSTGISKLSDTDIEAIENGIANYRFIDGNQFEIRTIQIISELHNYSIGNNPEGNSVTQRLEFWKTAIRIIQQTPLIGVGTGDVQQAFDKEYEASNSQLSEQYRLRAHNQYITIAVTFGTVGLVWFMLVLLYPIFVRKYRTDFFFVIFFIIIMLSMINEDTLETQAGVSFFALFWCVFLFGRATK